MKKTLLLLTVIAFGIVSRADASHVVGMHITYEYSGAGNDYIFRLKLYRDCIGISAPFAVTVNFSSVTCGANFNSSLPLTSSNQIPLNPCAGIGLTSCQGGTVFGFEEYNYMATVSVPPCSDWVVSCSICCRNSAITNVINPDFYANYVETRFDNLNFPGNSSPGFNTIPMNYYCVGIPSLKDYSAFDIDGDSLRYEFVPVLDNNSATITLANGYTYDQPLAVFSLAYLDSLNGILLFTPSMIQISSLAFLVSEYRNGVLIGTVRVDDEIVVASGIANPDTISGRVYFDNNSDGTFNSGDQAVPNLTLSLTPGNLYATTAGNGKYEFFAIDGIWDIDIPNIPQYTTITPATINVNTNGITYSGNNDFILDPVPNMNDLEIYLNQVGNPIPGQNYPLQITYKNTGTTIQSNVNITLTLDPLLQFINSTPPPSNTAGNTLTWSIPSVSSFSTSVIDITTSVSTSATLGAPIYCVTNITPVTNDLTPGNNSDFIDDNVATSCDPNFKEVFPAGDLGLSFINAQNWLNYTIHFQNLGTAPAQIIRIRDLLDPDLDLSSLEFITSSFPCAMTLTSPNQLEFSFFGINLPAAIVNEPASHGFVEYRIRPKSTLQPGTYITNNAGIYFDFNAPVYTNLVHNKVVTAVGIEENTVNQDQLLLYPNPTSDFCILEIFSPESQKVEIEIYNVMGLLVKTFEQELLNGINRTTIPTMDLSSGNYFIFVAGNKVKLVSKFSVVK